MSMRSRWARQMDLANEPSLRRKQARGARESKLANAGGALSQGLARVGVFWSAERLALPAAPFRGTGARVASAEWTRALARYGDIFAPIAGIEHCRDQFSGMPMHAYGAERSVAHIFPQSDIPGRFRDHCYDVLHTPMDLDLNQSSYVRSRLSGRIFPVTCAQMAISYSFQLQLRLVKLLSAQIYACDAIVCSTETSRRAMEKRLLDSAEGHSRAWERPAPPLPRLAQIPWGVDAQFVTPRDQATARRDLGLPPDRPILLCVGRVRIEDKMDWTPVLLAFERVSRTVKQSPILVLAGATFSEYGQQLLAQVAQLGLHDDIRTFFNLPSACLPSLYAACDVFVSPVDSPSESFGLTIVEAMACGRPVVASDWDGYKELIVHGETGFKVRTDWADCLGELNELAPALAWEQEHLHVGQSVSVDVGQMAGYLTQLLENRELREEMGRRGRARVEALYDWPVVIAQWEALWEELAAIARTIERKEQDRLDYLQPNYFQHFSHYASRIIDDATPVQLTPRGKEVLAGKAPFFLHPWAQGFLHPRYMHAVLATLKPFGWIGASLVVGDLVEGLRKAHGLSRDQALMHTMWLAKYDLLSLGEEEPSDDFSSGH
jgi:D-inositol-3-phosphate glycosyltransferase